MTAYDRRLNAWRIADNFLELSKQRRTELAGLIEKELAYVSEKVTHDVLSEVADPSPRRPGVVSLRRCAMKPDTEKQAKEFAATFAVTLSDKQHRVFVEKLAEVLRSNYETGLRDGGDVR